MLFVVLVPVAPLGKVQVYELALAIAGKLYKTFDWFAVTLVLPTITPAVLGNRLTTMAVAAEVNSQSLFLFTVTE